MASWLSKHTVLEEDPSLVPSTHVKYLTTTITPALRSPTLHFFQIRNPQDTNEVVELPKTAGLASEERRPKR